MSDAPITDKFRQMAPVIMQRIMEALEIGEEDAAAVLGNMGVETGGFSLRLESGKPKESQGYGWCQWTGYDPNKSDRRLLFEQWCDAHGFHNVVTDPAGCPEDDYNDSCLGYFLHEASATWEKRVFEGPGATINGVWYDPVPDCPTLESKTISFMRLFERPGTPHEDWRVEMAYEALRVYQGSPEAPGEIPEEEHDMPYSRICISSGHGLYVRGASSAMLDEVDEARLIADALGEALRARGVWVDVWHDDVSKSQSENLDRICDHHNSCTRDLDISIHLNANEQREACVGTEVWYVTQSALAAELSEAMAEAMDVPDRGGKYTKSFAFLNGTDAPACLVEVIFLDSECDVDHYRENWDELIEALATVLGGEREEEVPEPPPERPERPPRPIRPIRPPPIAGRVDMDISGDVTVIINGQQVWPTA